MFLKRENKKVFEGIKKSFWSLPYRHLLETPFITQLQRVKAKDWKGSFSRK